MSEPTLIPIDLIIRDARLQSRVDPVDPDVAERYTALYADGPAAMDAIEVYREAGAAGEGQVWLTDGWTRLAAAERAGLREILATIRAGTWRDALLASWEANGRHGARLTRADQRRKGEAIMSDPELAGQPLRALEHRFGVGRELLRTIQTELEAAGRSVRPATITDAAGREQPTKKPRGRPPGSKNRPKTAEEEGMRYARGLRTEARGLLEDLHNRDIEVWDLHGEAQETSLWLEALDDTSVTELESALPVLRVRASLPGKPAPPAVVQQIPATDALPVVAEVSSDAGDDGDDAEAAGEAAAADPPRELRPSTAESRPVRDLLCHLRDAGVERIGEGEEYSWGVRGVLDRLNLGNVQHRELIQISAAAERAALQLPQYSDERLAGLEAEIFSAVEAAAPDPTGAVAVGAPDDVAELLGEMSPAAQAKALSEAVRRIEELEREVERLERGLVAARTLAQGLSEVYGEIVRVCDLPLDDDSVTPDDVLDVITERFKRAAATSPTPAADPSVKLDGKPVDGEIEEIDELRAQLEAAHKALAIQLDEREGRVVPRGWPRGWREVHDHLWRAQLGGPEISIGYQDLSVRVLIPPRATRAEALEDIRAMAWAADRLESRTPAEPPPPASPTSDTPPSSVSCVEPVGVADVATGPRAAARVLDEVPEQLRLAALLVGTLPDKDVSAATAQPLKVVRKLRSQLGWEASPRSLTTDELADQLRIYAAQDVAQLAYMLNVPPGERLTERLALELAGRMW